MTDAFVGLETALVALARVEPIVEVRFESVHRAESAVVQAHVILLAEVTLVLVPHVEPMVHVVVVRMSVMDMLHLLYLQNKFYVISFCEDIIFELTNSNFSTRQSMTDGHRGNGSFIVRATG